MSKPNGKQPMERVADALQNLANKLDEQGEAIKGIDTRLDKQDDTLRMIWTQCKGDPTTHLPIDD